MAFPDDGRAPEPSCVKAEEFRKAAEEGRESPADLNFPLMIDDDAAHLRVFPIGLVTRTRREGGGYLRRRWVY